MKYQLILESLLYYSPGFKSILSRIEDPIAKDIISMEGENITQDITFIDIDKDGVVTFAPMAKSIKKINDFLDSPSEMDTIYNIVDNDDMYRFDSQGLGPDVYSGNRNQIKIGKLVNKILGKKYNDSQIENFVNKLKANLETKQMFDIISGIDIRNTYDVKRHAYRGKGSLGNSCMNTHDFFDLYTENEDVCRMLVLREFHEDGYKIVGRALVWKLKSCIGSKNSKNDGEKIEAKYLLDRIYTSDEYLEHKFIEYSKKQNWAYKTYQGYGWRKEITFQNRLYNADMSVKVKPGEYNVYPYMDTFTRLDVSSGTLYNDNDIDKQGHILNSTQGTYTLKFYPKKNLIKKFRDYFNI
jgi:hypothetical protein